MTVEEKARKIIEEPYSGIGKFTAGIMLKFREDAGTGRAAEFFVRICEGRVCINAWGVYEKVIWRL